MFFDMMLQHWLVAFDILRQSSVLIAFNLWRWGHYFGLNYPLMTSHVTEEQNPFHKFWDYREIKW